jgi:UDP-N-acetylglucosamine acyltransferase
MMIHPTAIIDPSAKIGDGVQIGPYSVIGAHVEIGANTWIGPHVVINGPTRIGRDNRIFQFASLGEATQALGQDPEQGILEIGDRNIIREYATMNRGSSTSSGVTRVGNDGLFMAYTHIAHDCILGDHIIFSNAATIAGHVLIGDYAILGGFTAVHQFVQIGAHSFSGFSAAINRDVPPYVIVSGNHASAYGINKEGLRRRGFKQETVRALHKAYMALIKSHQKREEAIDSIEDLIRQHPEVAEFVDFIRNSQRGIVRSHKSGHSGSEAE